MEEEKMGPFLRVLRVLSSESLVGDFLIGLSLRVCALGECKYLYGTYSQVNVFPHFTPFARR
jgi:hypothetical protein